MNHGSNRELTEADYERILDDAIQSTSRTIMRKTKRENTKKEPPQLSKEEHELIFDTALDQSKVMKPKQNKTVNPFLPQYLSTNKVLIQYVKDVNGYPKGIVVAISKMAVNVLPIGTMTEE